MSPRIIFSIPLLLLALLSVGQAIKPFGSGEILQRLDKLNTLGSILYVAAHPDDENTKLISYLANGKHLRTAYLSATRGDGGQNLIGSEIRELLGIIRTQELLAARKIDGGEQFFTRANDFGYSKDPEETFNKWDKEKVLGDMVWVIRNFKPDIMVTRFNTTPGVTHGHHTASAILAKEAFELSGNPEAYPEQLEKVDVWSPKRIVWNTSPWFFSRSENEFKEEDYLKLDVGGYNQFLGDSYNEISALSRSMHKSQGFGSSGSRGTDFEYFQHWGGIDSKELFDSIDFTWERIDGSEQVAYHLKEAKLNFNSQEPSAILPSLILARKELLKLPDQYWKEIKLKEIRELILGVTGTYINATATDYLYTDGDSISINVEVINRSPAAISLNAVKFSMWDDQILYNLNLVENQRIELNNKFVLPKNMAATHPYWLEKVGTEGMYTVLDSDNIGKPQNDPFLLASVLLKIDDQFLEYEIPVSYKKTDPVKGEIYRPLEVAPAVMVTIDNKAIVFGDESSKSIPVKVIAGKSGLKGEVSLDIPEGWKVSPSTISFELENKWDEQSITFELTPPKTSSEAEISVIAKSDGKIYNRGLVQIEYDHFPVQTLFPRASTKVVKIDLSKRGDQIGYIMGAGDDIPYSLEQVGYNVTLLDKDDIELYKLQKFDAVILGVRAFNTIPWLSYKNQVIFDYIKAGGNVVVQYNTSHRLVTEEIAPFPMKLSRNRVTVEEEEVRITSPNHQALNTPNIINKNDFEGWVQERGLYFPNEWSQEFTPLFSINDPGEDPKAGSTLIAQYGLGHYSYTSLSFFRELPAGVPGAYRLFVNMISLGNHAYNEK